MPSIPPVQAPEASGLVQVDRSSSGLPLLAVGDVVEASVLQSLDPERLLISLDQFVTVAAQSQLPLQAGDTVLLMVEEVRPKLVFRIAGGLEPEAEKITEYLRLQRSNPGALEELVSAVSERFDDESLGALQTLLNRENIQSLLNLMESIQLSRNSCAEGQFFRDYIGKLGLLWESDLRTALGSGEVGEKKSIKGLLLAISDELKGLTEEESAFDPAIREELKRLLKFTDASVKTIEANQVANVLAQETEGRYFFQIPFASPAGPHFADMLIEFEGKEKKGADHPAAAFYSFWTWTPSARFPCKPAWRRISLAAGSCAPGWKSVISFPRP